jgi:hypothetical protein
MNTLAGPKEYLEAFKMFEGFEAEAKELKNKERIVTDALQAAIAETIQRIVNVIINEKRAEIEAALNFEDLQNAVAAELARQFMVARLTDQITPFDTMKQKQINTLQHAQNNALAQIYQDGTKTP